MVRMTKKLREQIVQTREGGLCNPFGIGSYYVVLALKELYLTPDCLMADVEVLDTPQGRIIKRLSECGSEFILTPRLCGNLFRRISWLNYDVSVASAETGTVFRLK